MAENLLVASGLRKHYGDLQVLRGVDLEIHRGECFGLLGPNGAGKTTTVRAILGHVPLDGGRIEVFGLPMPEAAERVRARLGVVPQLDNLDPDFTVAENLLVYGRYFGFSPRRIRGRMDELLEFVALSDRADQPIAALSGGMKRRLTIARALINDPELLLLDEPSTGLDPQARHLVWQRLRALRQAGKTLILTTHYMEEAERLCDRLVIMDRGRILAQGSPDALIRAHVPGQVLELRRRDGAIPDPEDRHRLWAAQAERVGDTLLCYMPDPAPLAAEFAGNPDYAVLRRPANLEDVFLRLTGRELRD